METSLNTRELLEKITDTGRFEILATDILRAANPLYKSLSHPGVNAEGKPVKSPVDALITTYSEDGKTLVLVAHTTTAKNKLRGKWLTDADSDCVKALKIISDERKRGSIDRACIVLTTNREPSEDLVRDVHATAGADEEIDIWTGSGLASFLDNDPEGQWLRAKAFGKSPTRVSVSLLKNLSNQSLEVHRPQFDLQSEITRQADSEVEDFARQDSGIGFVIGESGQGKSVACWRHAKRWLEQGNIAFFLSLIDGD